MAGVQLSKPDVGLSAGSWGIDRKLRLAACACLQLVWDGGVRPPCSYAALRAALEALLANRLPDVELLTAGGRGVLLVAATYAAERDLTVTAVVADFHHFPADAPDPAV
jgi:hypothetical protein